MASIRKTKKKNKKAKIVWINKMLANTVCNIRPKPVLFDPSSPPDTTQICWKSLVKEGDITLYTAGCDPIDGEGAEHSKSLKSFSLVKWENGIPTIIK